MGYSGKLCFPTEECGLGFRSSDDMMTAFSCKLWWRLRKNKSVWSEFVFSKYIKELHPSNVHSDRPSWNWRRLLDIRDLVEENIF